MPQTSSSKKNELWLGLVSLTLLFHSVRNAMQYFGVNNILTQFLHPQCAFLTNKLLNLFGFSYSNHQELGYFWSELSLSCLTYRSFIKKRKKNRRRHALLAEQFVD